MARHLKPQQFTSAVAQVEKGKQPVKGQGRNHKEIDSRDRLRVVAKERLPALRRRTIPHHVFRDGGLGDLKAQHQQFAMDAGRSPLRVFPAHPSDKVTQATIDLWPPCPLSRLPPPERRKAPTLPSNNFLRLTDLRRAEQVWPKPGHPD